MKVTTKTRGGLVRLLRGREDAVSAALIVQLAAFLVLPALHLVNHRADHTHGPGGVTHAHRLPVSGGAPKPAPLHDEHGSALHFGLALTSTTAFVWASVASLLLLARLSFPAARSSTRAPYGLAAPRGPPLPA